MHGITYLNAYELAEYDKMHSVNLRSQGRQGIAVIKDDRARFWQRRDRQSRKFYQRIAKQLIQSETDSDSEERQFCLLCFIPGGSCEHDKKYQRRYVVKARRA